MEINSDLINSISIGDSIIWNGSLWVSGSSSGPAHYVNAQYSNVQGFSTITWNVFNTPENLFNVGGVALTPIIETAVGFSGSSQVYMWSGTAAITVVVNASVALSTAIIGQTAAVCLELFRNGVLIPGTTQGLWIEDRGNHSSQQSTMSVIQMEPLDTIEARIVNQNHLNAILASCSFNIFRIA
jgi:hypothetical protein